MSIQQLIIATILLVGTVASLTPGLEALELSLESLIESKKTEAKEFCYAKVARQKTAPASVDAAQFQCEEEEVAKVAGRFKPAVEMISAFRKALPTENTTPTNP